MSDMGTPEGFYEEDEPLQDVIAAFERGEQGVTRPPVMIDTAGLAAPDPGTTTFPAKISVARAPIQPIQPVLVRGTA
jgi:hypothetical protein